MKASERQDTIVRIVNERGTVSIAELQSDFDDDVSNMTLRRDLELLDRQNRIVRIHGGARSVMSSIGAEDNYLLRNTVFREYKEVIAAKAAALLKPNTCVFLDSGTTVTKFCEFIKDDLQLLIYTSGLTCAMELKRLEHSEIYLLGGRLNKVSYATYGSDALDSIKDVHFNIAFIGSTGFCPEYGFTCENSDDARIKREAIQKSDKCVVLLDSSKIGRSSTYTFASIKEINVVVSDAHLDEDTKNLFRNADIEVI